MATFTVYVNAVVTDDIHLEVIASSEAEAKALVAKYIRDCNNPDSGVDNGYDTEEIAVYNYGSICMGKTIKSVELA